MIPRKSGQNNVSKNFIWIIMIFLHCIEFIRVICFSLSIIKRNKYYVHFDINSLLVVECFDKFGVRNFFYPLKKWCTAVVHRQNNNKDFYLPIRSGNIIKMKDRAGAGCFRLEWQVTYLNINLSYMGHHQTCWSLMQRLSNCKNMRTDK